MAHPDYPIVAVPDRVQLIAYPYPNRLGLSGRPHPSRPASLRKAPVYEAVAELFRGAGRTKTDLCSTLDLTDEVFQTLQDAAGPAAYVGDVYPEWHPSRY